MATKPEAAFVKSVNKHLPSVVYHEGMANDYRGGTPDRYYEGNFYHLWIEYKWFKVVPPVIELANTKAKTCLSSLQQRWLNRAFFNGQPVAVIVGFRDGGVIMPGNSWDNRLPRDDFMKLVKTRKEIAQWITQVVHKDEAHRQTHSVSNRSR